MRSPLPPLPSVRVFEAAARHLSFTRAAEELGMTQAAVSYQMKILEERVGAPLFFRQARGVELTKIGQRFSRTVGDALDLLSDGYMEAKVGGEETLTLSVIAPFATNILAQRLGQFQIANPTIAVRVDANPALVDFTSEDVDIAIRTGAGSWPGLKSHFLMPIEFSPMLSPRLVDNIDCIKAPSDLLNLPIIESSDPWWQQWFKEAGVSTDAIIDQPSLKFSSQTLSAQAVIAGQGVGILTPGLYKDAMEQGTLIQPFDLMCNDGSAYWLVYPKGRQNASKIRAFRNWILQEIKILNG